MPPFATRRSHGIQTKISDFLGGQKIENFAIFLALFRSSIFCDFLDFSGSGTFRQICQKVPESARKCSGHDFWLPGRTPFKVPKNRKFRTFRDFRDFSDFLRFLRFFGFFRIWHFSPDLPESAKSCDFWHPKSRHLRCQNFQIFWTFWTYVSNSDLVSIIPTIRTTCAIFLSFLLAKKLKKYITSDATT